jgi:molybdopterin-guanine dinucleotide biosynthesis adapter protein
VVVSKGSLALFADVSEQLKVEEVRDRFVDASYDLIIAEGWKSEGYPKIIIVRDQLGEISYSPDGLLAVVSDKPITLPVPVLHLDDVAGVAAILIKQFPRRRREHELEA